MPSNASHSRRVAGALAELRAFGADVDRLDAAAAVRLGLNRTDLRVMELLNRAGPLPAGQLASATGLTTAAVTTVIDRLADRELAVRRYDPTDRRRVMVEPTPRAAAASDELFADLLSNLRELLDGYSDDHLDAIVSFVGGIRAVFGEQIERLRIGGRRQPDLARRRSSGSPDA